MKKLLFSNSCQQCSLACMRVILGLAFVYYGYGKMFNPEKWAWLGSNMPFLNTGSFAVFWGFMAAFSEFFGGLALVFGFLTRPAAFLIACTMGTAVMMHCAKGESYVTPLVYALFALCFVFSGSGKYGVDNKFAK